MPGQSYTSSTSEGSRRIIFSSKMLTSDDFVVKSRSMFQDIRGSGCSKKIIFIVVLTVIFAFVGIGIRRTWSVNIFIQSDVDNINVLPAAGSADVLNVLPGPGHADEQTWRKKTVFEIFDSFRPRTLDTCVDNCDANDTSSPCSLVSYEDWNKALSSTTFQYSPFLTGNQYIFEFEKEHLSYPPLSDSKELPDLTLSTVVIEDVQDGVVSCNVNDTISGRVDLIDGYGKQRTSGGDEVRVWVVNEFNFRASGYVIDLRNGSYQIFVRCLWPGAAKIHIAVAYPREFIRATIHHSHVGMARFLMGRFENNGTEEHTICWSAPNIPGRLCVCNYTTFNQQSFYCGRPLDKRLTCDDWKATKPTTLPPPHNVTTDEMKLILSMPTKDIKKYTIRHNVTLLVNKSGQLPQLSPCSSISPEVTWDIDNRPQGYWSPDNKWASLVCKRQGWNLYWTASCLQNTTIHVIGDSNGVRLYSHLRSASQCVTTQPGGWPDQEVCTNFKKGITVVFTPHEYPLYLGLPWKHKLLYGGVAKQIDAMPSKGRVVVIVHYFLHVMVSHLAVTRVRLIALRDAIDRLLKRNPDAMAAFRGPHVSSFEWDYNHTIGGDVLGMIYLSMLKEIFSTLKDKVVFLDGWDMTSSIENSAFHPTTNVPHEMIRTLLSFRCTENGNVQRVKI
ncbi:unnamed protein product [Lymnaea stagnalis]|uniref:NXPE C-terminal domain-containing protein n=1 Tax=Lymnaea stagnalis TaxID=6523 RepID=A0AAV2HIP2_LYMST